MSGGATDRSARRRPRLAVGVVAAIVVVGGAFIGLLATPTESEQVGPTGSAALATGESLYRAHCAACHGVNLEGAPNWRTPKPDGRYPAPPHDDSGHTWHHDDRTLFGITKLGTAGFSGLDIESDMPAYRDTLSDAEIQAVLAYIKSRWSERTRRRQAALNARAPARR